ncbi:sugar phosphate isomerase/epimerase [Chlorobaculum sp. MV4-Y]|jgi:sugar phosphate isomerase/epimerase|uniref:cobamide remodeling phosphodiesterase CbiR n=1 Tax=Chlorobaculum sp. MV4-Y TaxID=2976335 RepID=UPI0021AE442B|nr:cobamide remodeling phosphodiesterase CbiR [Chlorobaculum sp. MV4-Y]UWX58411.1 sugar phosphate isomerase/epimerase [Chlorobaculum sp. MV4-Y]
MKQYPFRLGTSSYIIPDDILPNMHYLVGKVEDVELVLFESDEFSNLPSPEVIAELVGLAAEHGLTYSVHLPLDVYLGNPDRVERERSVGKYRRIIDLTEALPKSAFVMHFEAGKGVDINDFSDAERALFVESLADSARMLLGGCGYPASMFCAENLNYPFELVWPVIEQFGFSVTLDVGHLEYYGFPTADYLDRYLSRTRVLHMHGTTEGRDHNSLAYMRPEALDLVVEALRKAEGEAKVFTLEIFSEADFLSSVETLERFSS